MFRVELCLLLGFWLFTSFGCRQADRGLEDGSVTEARLRVATLHRRVGSVGGLEGDAFGRLSSIALHPSSVLVATDDLTEEIVFISSEGKVLKRIDGNPAGPGHFGDPCCISVDANGDIWIYSRHDRRFIGFDLAGHYLGEIGRDIPFIYVGPPLMFDRRGGHLIRVARPPRVVHLTATGDTGAYPTPPLPVSEMLGTITNPDGRQAVLPVPFGRRPLVAYRRDGYYAQASSERYTVKVYDERGTSVLSIVRDAEPTELRADQRDSARAVIEAYAVAAKRSGAELAGFEIPERDQVLERIWFDELDRLWIQRTTRVAVGHAQADVYDVRGKYVFTALWPDSISLSDGAIRDNVAWGMTKGAYGIDVLIRMSFEARPEGR